MITTRRRESRSTASQSIEMPMPGSSLGCHLSFLHDWNVSQKLIQWIGAALLRDPLHCFYVWKCACQVDMERREDMREHGPPGSRCEVDCFDGAREPAYGGRIDAQDIDSAHQIGNHAGSENVFPGRNWSG